MFPFVFFFVAVLLFSSKIVAGNSICNESIPLYPFRNPSEVEIHAMLARDRYIDYIQGYDGFLSPKGHRGVEGVKIPYGYVKELIVHFSSTKEGNGTIFAKIFLVTAINYLNINYKISKDGQDGVKYRDAFLRFRFFQDGYRVDEYYIPEEGDPEPKNGNDGECHKYIVGGGYYPFDSLLIQINCETTIVKKILVKCHPYPEKST